MFACFVSIFSETYITWFRRSHSIRSYLHCIPFETLIPSTGHKFFNDFLCLFVRLGDYKWHLWILRFNTENLRCCNNGLNTGSQNFIVWYFGVFYHTTCRRMKIHMLKQLLYAFSYMQSCVWYSFSKSTKSPGARSHDRLPEHVKHASGGYTLNKCGLI